MYALARPLLFHLDAERAHDLALAGIDAAHRAGLGSLLATRPAALPTQAFGLSFGNPVGLAAGLDKNGAYIDALASLGFGFIEIGTTTPRAQPGNPKPRMFRLPEHEAVINRLWSQQRCCAASHEGGEPRGHHGTQGDKFELPPRSARKMR